MTPAALADLVSSSAEDVLTSRGLDPTVLPATITITCPRDPRRGDYATTMALQVAKRVDVAPREFAGWLGRELVAGPAVHHAEVAGPGFLNLRLTAAARGEIIRHVLATGQRFGTDDDLADRCPPPVAWPGADSVCYAHARLAALTRNAADLGVNSANAYLELLEQEQETQLIAALGEFPAVVASTVRRRQPHRLARYLEQLAGNHHIFSDVCRMLPRGDEESGPGHAARLALCQATRQVLANGLGLFRMNAPERM